MFYLISDKHKYIILTFPKSGCTLLRLLHIYLNKNDNEVINYKFEDKHHYIRRNCYNPFKYKQEYDTYYKVVVYRDPYERLCSAFYQKVCGVMSNNITYKNKLIEQPYKLNNEYNSFNKWLDLIICKKTEDYHFDGQKYNNFNFDQKIEINNIQNIFENNKDLNKLANETLIKYKLNNRNSLEKYDLKNSRDLSNYDFYTDKDKLLIDNKVPKYKYLLSKNIINKIKNNYDDDFL
jgi:hypothetical protein